MSIVRYPIKLNVRPSPYPFIKNIALVQGDTANVFAIELLDNKQPFSIKDCYVTATFKKSDENVVVSAGQITDELNGLVDVPVLSQAVAYPGKTYCTIEVYNKDKLRLTSIMFEFTVIEELGNEEDITSVTEYTILQTLITDVQGIKVVEEQRVINENIRIQNETDRQTVFDGIVNTANTTKDGLDASIINADVVKANLDDSITTGTKLNDNLTNVINNGDELTNTLSPLIENANTSKTNLDTSIDNANNAKTNLDGSINLATSKKTLLDTSISDGTALNADLDGNISAANIINDILSDATDGTIKIATEIDNELKNTINTVNTSKGDLDAVINTSNTSKINLDNSISTANTVKFDLDESITTGTSVREDLEQIISGTDFEQVIIDLDYMKNQINEPKYLTTTSYDNIIPLSEGSANGQVSSTQIKGRTLKQELSYNKDTYAEWVLNTGSTIENNAIKMTTGGSHMSTTVSLPDSSHSIKPNKKYGFLFYVHQAQNPVHFTTSVFSPIVVGDTVIPTGVTGYHKAIANSISGGDYTSVRFRTSSATEYTTKFSLVRAFELPTGSEIENDFNTMTADQLAVKYPYIKGDSTKSTISAIKVKSVGKNLSELSYTDQHSNTILGKPLTNAWVLSDGKWSRKNNAYHRSLFTGEAGTISSRDVSMLPKLEPNTTYYLRADTEISYLNAAIFNPDGTLSGNSVNLPATITTSSTDLYLDIRVVSQNDIRFTNLMISKVNAQYEPYKEDISYIVAKDKDNKIVNLRSLPNGTKDEIRVIQNKAEHIQRTKNVIFNGTENWLIGEIYTNTYRFDVNIGLSNRLYGNTSMLTVNSNFLKFEASFADEEHYYSTISSPYTLRVFVAKSSIDSQVGSTVIDKFKKYLVTNRLELTYQLAEPEIIPIRWTGLQGYKDGTVYFDTIIPEVGMYYNDCLETNYPDHPILSIDSLYKVDKENGLRVALDVAKCVISEDGLSFTHPDLVNGDLCDWDYVPITETTQGEKTIISTGNLNSVVDGLLVENKIQKENIREINSRVDHNCNELLSKASIVDIPTQISQLDNDVGYVTQGDVGQIVTSDVLEFSSLSTFPTTGETGKIYVAIDTNLTYRWSGTVYVEISPSIALGETSTTAYRGDRGKTAYDHSQSTHARIDATKVESSTTNGNIKINGTEINVYTHPANHDDRYYTETEIDTKLSDKVDNSRVLTDVPANAKFTDTIYTHPDSHPASMITGLPNSLPADGGNADTVGGFTVGTNVPAGAKFTDTTYAEITTAEIDVGTASTLRTITARRLKYLLDKIVALFPTKVSELTNDSGFLTSVTKSDVELGNVDNIKQMPISGGVLENYREKLVTLSGTSVAVNLNNGNVFTHTLSGTTTYSITNAQSQAHSFTLIITQTGTVRTITFPASVKWQGGETPDLSTASKTYILTFLTIDGGTTWLGMFGGEF